MLCRKVLGCGVEKDAVSVGNTGILNVDKTCVFFYVLPTVYLSIILVIDQLNAKILVL